jgi:hypothetical protein
MIRWLSILTLLFLLSSESFSQNRTIDDKLRDLIKSYGQADVIIPYPGRNEMETITRKVSITSVAGGKVHISLSASTVNWFTQQNFPYTISEPSSAKGLITANDAVQATDWQSYPSYTDYVTIMKGFASAYPSICRLDTIGTSIYGKLILVLKISDNVNVDEPEPEVFYTSTIHGDETGGFILMMRLADTLLKSYSSSQRIKNMVDNMEIWINPLSNPDGTYRTGNTITSPIRYNANGIDLNRNFPDPLSPSIVQEKENVDMMNFLRERRFVLSANFHAGAELVNYPWDRWYYKYHPDDTWFYSISRAYADTVQKYSGNGYFTDENNGITRGAVWYVIYGGRQDYVTWELQGREVTIELDHIHQTPSAQLELLWQYNRRSLLTYLENALYGVHGFVRDAATSAPVAAKIKINGHDRDSSQVYSDTLTGVYTRMLYPRLWDISFSANGYRDTIIYNVQVISGKPTILDVNLKPISSDIVPTRPGNPLLYPNPASGYIYCRLPDNMDGALSIRVTDTGGRRFSDYKTQYSRGEILAVDISALPEGTFIITFVCKGSGISYNGRFVVLNNHD